MRWFVGTWPDWGTYLGLIGKYSVHEFGTLLIPSWSTGYAIAGVYVISSLGLAVVVAQPPSPRPKPAALAGIAGATAFGALSFTYFLGRSEPTNLHHLAIPAVITVCCWVDVLGCLSSSTRRFATITGTVIVAFVGAAVLTQSPTWTAAWINGSPLGQALRSPSTVATETRDLLRRQSLRPVVSESSRLLILYGRPGRPVAVLLRSDLLTDALLASETGNALPIVNGNQDRLNGEPSRALVRRSIVRLAAGSYVLTENVFLRRPPASFSGKDPPIAGDKRYGDYFIALALADVLKQFNTEVVTRGSHGLVVLRLEPKTAGE